MGRGARPSLTARITRIRALQGRYTPSSAVLRVSDGERERMGSVTGARGTPLS